MVLSVSHFSMAGSTPQMELAERLAGHTVVPEQVLKSLFDECMLNLKKINKIKPEPSMKEKIWEQVSGEKLEILRKIFLCEFCDRILGCFQEGEVEVMLQERERTGCVNGLDLARIKIAYRTNKETLSSVMGQYAEVMREDLIAEIIDAVRPPEQVKPFGPADST